MKFIIHSNKLVIKVGCVCFSAVPEFHTLVGNEASEELQNNVNNSHRAAKALKMCFTRMMNCEKKVFVDQLNMLVKRITDDGEYLCLFSSLGYVLGCQLCNLRSYSTPCYINCCWYQIAQDISFGKGDKENTQFQMGLVVVDAEYQHK